MESSASESAPGVHEDQPVARAGADLEDARAAMVLLHGRHATAQGILQLAEEFDRPEVAYAAPQAGRRTWYPYSFLAPLEQNEPALSSALKVVGGVVQHLADRVSPEHVVVAGFSQGACLALEYVARHPRRYGGVIAFSGGLIGSDNRVDVDPPQDKFFEYEGDLAGTPVFVGCSDADRHIPLERVHTTTEVMGDLGGEVTERIYEGMGHTINADEVGFVRQLLADLTSAKDL